MQIAAVYNRTTLWLVLLGIAVYWFQRNNNASNTILVLKEDGQQHTSELVMTPHQQKNGTRFSYNAQARKYNDMPRWMDRFPFLPAVEDVPDDSRICFVHVGKTAGSTMGCYLGFKYNDCNDRMRVLPGNLPLYTTNVVHTHFDTCQRERIALYLITLRDPVARMQSWFTYERPASVNARDYGYKKPLFVDCNFNTMDELGGSRGLGGMGRNPCSKMAWWAVQGIVGFKSHNRYNFAYYYYRHIPDHETARIAAIRTEYLEQDWISVEERLLGTTPNHAAFAEGFRRKNPSQKNDDDNYLSEESLKNICDALCEEIQVYKKLLKKAENLNDEEVAKSLGELYAKCPTETSQWFCPERDEALLKAPSKKMFSPP